MTEESRTAIVTLLGILIGSGLAIVGQRLEWGRQQRIRWDATRHEVYGKYIGSCGALFIALCEVRRSVLHDTARLDEASRLSEVLRAEVASLRGQVDMLAGRNAKLTSDALHKHLDDLNTKLYDRNRRRDENPPPAIAKTRELRAAYERVESNFVVAVNGELKIRRK